jgi:hypothetical protein
VVGDLLVHAEDFPIEDILERDGDIIGLWHVWAPKRRISIPGDHRERPICRERYNQTRKRARRH